MEINNQDWARVREPVASDAKLKGLQKKKTLSNPVFYEIKMNAKNPQ